jgi:hypothetical protein
MFVGVDEERLPGRFFNFVCGLQANGIQEDGKQLRTDVRQCSPDEGRLR